MKNEDIQEILAILAEAGKFKPVVKEIKKQLKGYGPDLAELIDGVADYIVDRNIKTFKKYIAAGLTTDQAFLLMYTGNDLKDTVKKDSKGK